MTLDTLFLVANASVMPFWLLMIFLPGWGHTARIARSAWIPIVPAALYAVAVVPMMPSLVGDLGQPELSAIVALFQSPEAVYVGWLHFLAFDLLVGRHVYREARARGVPALISSPILFFVLMFGPFGYCLWLLAGLRWPAAPAESVAQVG